MNFKKRLGVFLLLVGLLVLFVYFIGISVAKIPVVFFVFGSGCVLLGGLLLLRKRTPPAPSERFRTIRRLKHKQDEEGE